MKRSYKKDIFALLGTAMIAMAISGCAGSLTGGTPGSNEEIVAVNGGLPASSTTSPSNADATSGPVDITFPDGTSGTLVDGTVAPGDELAVLPSDVPVMENMFLDDGRAQGDVFMDFGSGWVLVGHLRNTGKFRQGAQLAKKLCLHPGSTYRVMFEGPFVVKSGKKRLHIHDITSTFEVAPHGLPSLPVRMAGVLPVDGGDAFDNGQSLTLSVVSAFDGRNFQFTVTHLNGVMQQTRTAVDQKVTYSKSSPGLNGQIPATGVQNLDFSIQ